MTSYRHVKKYITTTHTAGFYVDPPAPYRGRIAIMWSTEYWEEVPS